MNEYMISVEAGFAGPPGATDEQFGHFVNATAEEFAKLGGDLSVAASLTERTADFTALIEGPTEEDALARFLVDLRTALHAAGCATPDWPPFAVRNQEVRELQLV